MYSSPIVVFAGSSWFSVVPTATRRVPWASAGAVRPSATDSPRIKRRIVTLRVAQCSGLERLGRIRIDRPRHIRLGHGLVLLPEPCQGGDWRPIPVHAQVHVREALAVGDEEGCR